MTAPELMTVHPENETLAAFLDDRLNTNERREMIEHLAGCDECRTFLNDISDTMAMDQADNVVPMPKRGGWRVAAASVAVAAGLLVVFGPMIRERVWGASIDKLVVASARTKHRPTTARLSIDLPYKEAKRNNRGPAETEIVDGVPPELHDAIGDVLGAKRPAPHNVGIALLLAPEYGDAVPYLEQAAENNPNAKIDLAAALLKRGRDEDNLKALELSEQSNAPAALWNRALALEQLHRDKEAVDAWNAYLRVDSGSQWADEARDKIKYLEEFGDIPRAAPPSSS